MHYLFVVDYVGQPLKKFDDDDDDNETEDNDNDVYEWMNINEIQ